jgi:uncharacterized membrane protein
MNITTRKITASAITAAIVFVVTWTLRFPVPVASISGAYVNAGDVVIFISAYLFGGPMAAVSAAIGSALADTAAGAAVYVPATFLIKGLMGLCCGFLSAKKQFPMYAVSCVIGGAIMTVGYALYEFAIFGMTYAAASLPFNLVQWAGSTVIAIVLYPIAKRLLKAVPMN